MQQKPIIKRKRRENWQREITMQQKKVDAVIPSAPFRRVVNEFTESVDIRYQQEAIDALQVAAESYLVEMFQNANAVAEYTGRETLHREDITLALNLKK
jgi:histone H3